jgi:hypothetical protein
LFSDRSETKRNGSEILFASKQNRGVCFALKPNEKEWKQNEAKKAKRNETKEAKRKKQRKKSENNILKRNERKTISFCWKQNRKYGSQPPSQSEEVI